MVVMLLQHLCVPVDLEPSLIVFGSAYLAHETFSAQIISHRPWQPIAEWWSPLTEVLWDFSSHEQLDLLADYVFIVAVLVAFASTIIYGHGDFFGVWQ